MTNMAIRLYTELLTMKTITAQAPGMLTDSIGTTAVVTGGGNSASTLHSRIPIPKLVRPPVG